MSLPIYKYGSLKDLLLLDPDLPVMVDTETETLHSRIRLIQVYQTGMEQALLYDVTKGVSVDTVWDILVDHHLVGHNFLYDLFCFQADVTSFRLPERWDDTFYASRLVFPEYGKFTLDFVMTQTLGYDPYLEADLVKKELQMSFEVTPKKPRTDLTESQLLYASIDVFYLGMVWESVKSITGDFVYDLDLKTAEYQVGIYNRGIPIDLGKLKALRDADNKLVRELSKALPANLNVNSYIQVRAVLGLENSSDEDSLMMIAHRPGGVEGYGKNVKDSMGEWTVVEVEPNYDHTEAKCQLALDILQKRKSMKRLGFNDRTLAAMDENGRVKFHGSPHAINGRIQQSGENLTQWPRPMKSQFGFPEDSDKTLIYLDYAQIELRVICALLPEMNMYKSLKAGVDLHTFVGKNLDLDSSKLPLNTDQRFIAKQCNFLLLYGGGPGNFQKTVCKLAGIWFPDDLNKKIVSTWKGIFSDITAWHSENGKRAGKGLLESKTASGRRYVAKNFTDLNNIAVSGTAAEIFKLAIHYIMKYKVLGDQAYIVNEVHDSLVIEVPKDAEIYSSIAYNVALCFQKSWFDITLQCPLTDVPMPVDFAVGNNWEDLEYEKNTLLMGKIPEYYMMDKELKDELKY